MVYVSKKLAHVGLNSFHNEYMAQCESAKCCVWLRQLLGELELHDMIERPTVIFGDNNAALNLTVEDFISTGNQYVYLPYHYNKEVVELGYVKFYPKAGKVNLADLFTKPVTKQVIDALLSYLRGEKLIGTSTDRDGI